MNNSHYPLFVLFFLPVLLFGMDEKIIIKRTDAEINEVIEKQWRGAEKLMIILLEANQKEQVTKALTWMYENDCIKNGWYLNWEAWISSAPQSLYSGLRLLRSRLHYTHDNNGEQQNLLDYFCNNWDLKRIVISDIGKK